MSFWREVFSESGSPSFSRVATGALVFGGLAWVTIILLRTGALPSDLPALALFITSPYTINRAGAAVQSIKDRPPVVPAVVTGGPAVVRVEDKQP